MRSLRSHRMSLWASIWGGGERSTPPTLASSSERSLMASSTSSPQQNPLATATPREPDSPPSSDGIPKASTTQQPPQKVSLRKAAPRVWTPEEREARVKELMELQGGDNEAGGSETTEPFDVIRNVDKASIGSVFHT